MKYEKCPRCELNYILENERYCKICLDELNGTTEFVDIDLDICPFCEKSPLQLGEEMCLKCSLKNIKKYEDEIF